MIVLVVANRWVCFYVRGDHIATFRTNPVGRFQTEAKEQLLHGTT
jgi:hypothetical protein